ncbi:hypothetical protein HDU86_002998 [Geranomyces michiganensis]|nr:hypothetical protein HDU86_002998 [Geranomyces michiganensis]
MKSPIATAAFAVAALLGLSSSLSSAAAQEVSSAAGAPAPVTFGGNPAPAATAAPAAPAATSAATLSASTTAGGASATNSVGNANSTIVSAVSSSTVSASANVTVSILPTGTSTAVQWVTPAPVYPQPITQVPGGSVRPAAPTYAPLAPSSDSAAAGRSRGEVALGAVAGMVVLAAAGVLVGC